MRVMRYTDRGLVLPVETGVAGKYKVQVYRPDGRCRFESGWFDNLVTDAGLNLMGTGGYLDACQVGSGTTAPAVGDASLASFVAGTASVEQTTQSAEATSPFFGATTKRWRFAAGSFSGDNLSEVGVGTAATGGTLFSRAFITDSGGTETTITVLADEFLDVTYQIQSVPPTTDDTFNLTDSGPAGTVHGVTLRASRVTESRAVDGWANLGGAVELGSTSGGPHLAFEGAIGAITSSPSGSNDPVSSVSNTAYSNTSLEKLGSLTWGLDDGNLAAGIQSIRFVFRAGGGVWQAEFDPVIPKTDTDTLSIDVKTSWTRTTAL